MPVPGVLRIMLFVVRLRIPCGQHCSNRHIGSSGIPEISSSWRILSPPPPLSHFSSTHSTTKLYPNPCSFLCSANIVNLRKWCESFSTERKAKSLSEGYVEKPVSVVVLGASGSGNLVHSLWPWELSVELYLECESIGFMTE